MSEISSLPGRSHRHKVIIDTNIETRQEISNHTEKNYKELITIQYLYNIVGFVDQSSEQVIQIGGEFETEERDEEDDD